jgi:hypothetical protein
MITTDLHVNQIVCDSVETFVTPDFRVIGNECYVQLKTYNPETGRTARGELSFLLDTLETSENI